MADIILKTVTDGNIEQCRDLCNELMAYQKSRAVIAPQCFDGMNFETRLKATYENSPLNHLVVAYDGDTPIGYVFSTIEDVTEGDKSAIPPWAPVMPGQQVLGFYPADTPAQVGCLNHLYFRPAYRGQGLGGKLLALALEWLERFAQVGRTFVYISNGNREALDFYLKHGFVYSHEVFGGFIQAAYKMKG